MGLFAVEIDFPSVEAPAYLQQLNPQLYEEECRRVQSRFDEAVRLAEEAFTAELAKLVSHLTERLSGTDNGKPKTFRDSAVENLTEFFQRFRELNVRSSEQLDQLVGQAQRVIRGVQPQDLRDNAGLRQHVATEMSRVQSVLDGLLVDKPRRNIFAARSDGGCHATHHHARRGCPVHLQRSNRPCGTGQPRHYAGIPRRARPAGTLVGRPFAGWRAWIGAVWDPERSPGRRTGVVGNQLADAPQSTAVTDEVG